MRATLLLCTALAGCASFPNDVSGKQASVLSELRLSLRETGEGLEAGTPTRQQQPREWLGATATAAKTSEEEDDAILWPALSGDPSPRVTDVDISSVRVKNKDEWTFLIAPYAWLPTVAGDASVQGSGGPVALTMDDVLDSAVFAFTGRAQARKGDWVIMLDGLYFNLENDEQAGPTNVDVQMEYSQIDVAVGYRVLEVPVHDSQLTLEAKLGTRWQYLSLDIDLTPGPPVNSQSRDWQELLVGCKAILEFNERASFAAAVDFSGFGIGSGSRLTWNLELIMRYMMTESTMLAVGYRLLDIDVSYGSAASRNNLDAQFSGPVLGVGFVF